MAALVCQCEQNYKTWGEFWWMGDVRGWWFYDDLETSETYTERVYHPSVIHVLPRR